MNFVKLEKSAWVGVLRDDKHGTECQRYKTLFIMIRSLGFTEEQGAQY